MNILPLQYFQQEDTIWLAKDLIGKILVTRFDGMVTSGRIVETEAYLGVTDKASHAFGGKRTARTETMYLPGGHAYVYLCYGIHHLFNVVTHKKEIPQAILIRALEPLEGIDMMLQRRNKKQVDETLTRGPGSLAKALGLLTSHSGMALHSSSPVFMASDNEPIEPGRIACGPRIGVDYAGEDATLPYRFFLFGNPHVTKPNR